MVRLVLCFLFAECSFLAAQPLTVTPEVVLGHRSSFYQHELTFLLTDKLKLRNTSLYDAAYDDPKAVLYFFRNTLAYAASKSIVFSVAHGVKNPGAFGTASVLYHYSSSRIVLMCSGGVTYQREFSFEPFVLLEYNTPVSAGRHLFFRVQGVANISKESYMRGVQQVRVGLKQDKLRYGLAGNFDQFANAAKKLSNLGVFIRYTI
ncbi:hypothetical protein EZL74_05660 [Flavobacterium silvisoli]|uniref:Uncharacterized protein n=1 Tax=Flavobacterium silvisoli TaxID=2529433 RepID=A0A4Q9Z106_9FLAO|nr:hypothetical protein [Flavobacterium silvisoli]TBX69902.1 hypothetical protein EZL74_05660 [Flavobacterium silvisoli]